MDLLLDCLLLLLHMFFPSLPTLLFLPVGHQISLTDWLIALQLCPLLLHNGGFHSKGEVWQKCGKEVAKLSGVHRLGAGDPSVEQLEDMLGKAGVDSWQENCVVLFFL